jgi:penicillin-binding protein 2
MGLIVRERRWRSPRRRASSPDANRIMQRKFALLYGVIILAFLVLSGQLLRLQVIGGARYRDVSDQNRVRPTIISPQRGLIYDRNGNPLAINGAAFNVVVVPSELVKGKEGEVYAALQEILRVPAFEIEQSVKAARRRSDVYARIVVKRAIDPELALVLSEREGSLPGMHVDRERVRVYPSGELTSHLLGYVGRIEPDELKSFISKDYLPDDRTGRTGVELKYEGYLRGIPGKQDIEIDATGRALRVLGGNDARTGFDLVLSIDVDLQRAVSDILKESVKDLASKKAVAIVMDVRTGELLADVSLPAYDNNIFSYPLNDAQYAALTTNPDKPLLDHAIAEKYPPGSTFKIVTGVAALQEGVATLNTTIVSNGAMLVPRDYDPNIKDSFPDWRVGLGALSFYRGVAMSSDIYFYCLAGGCDQLKNGLGNEKLARYARNFGFGERTGIDLPGETDGLVGDAVWLSKVTSGAQNWFLADTYYQGIGQGYIEATPLQVVRMTAAVANGGQLLRPRVVREIRDSEGNVVLPAKTDVARRVSVSEQHLAEMREAMRQAVADGTATQAQVAGVQIAGKTGTAEFGSRLGAGSVYGKYKEHGWFTGFGPFEEPEVAVVVFHEQGGGALTAAPTAARILKAYFDLKQQRPATQTSTAGR